MLEILKELCNIDGTSGDEHSVRKFIISCIDGFCEWKIDALGNILVFKKGEKPSAYKIMLDAHMDEVGIIITDVTSEGFLKFKTVGGIDVTTLMFRKVRINGGISGVIGGKPIHLETAEECKKLPEEDSLYIDIGVKDKKSALEIISIGDRAVICGEFLQQGDKIISKALDDRAGCAVLIDLIRNYSEYDFYASFSVQEEIGLRGAKTAAFSIEPQIAIVLEATTAADIAQVSPENTVCSLSSGVAVSFMDKATVYDRELYNMAMQSKIKCQPKRAVSGGNNAGAIHLSKQGVRTIALSLPCRYIHSASCVADKNDLQNLRQLAEYMLNSVSGGDIK